MTHSLSRRRFVAAGGVAAVVAALPWRARAVDRPVTPPQARGPYYPNERPAEVDNDLVRTERGIAKGEVTLLSGTVYDSKGAPVAGARVEIWQCDANGRYHHPGDSSPAPLDAAFQGYGETVTGADGVYRFRTIKPVPYPGRAPHIHVRVSAPGRATLVTQLYVAGDPLNDRDGLLQGVRDAAARESLIVAFTPLPDRSALAARFDVTLGA
jgi:protocatechuate 3,4-dioxygenase beta subunit